MQNFNYFDSFVVHNLEKPIKGITKISDESLFLLLNDG